MCLHFVCTNHMVHADFGADKQNVSNVPNMQFIDINQKKNQQLSLLYRAHANIVYIILFKCRKRA